MASYAAVLSLYHVMENIKMYRLRYPKFLDEQRILLESLNLNIIFLQDFLEVYSSADDGNLERRIADAAYAAEDLIETYIVDYLQDIYDDSSTTSDGRMSSNNLSVELHKVLEGMDFSLKEVSKIKESNKFQVQQQRHLDAAALKIKIPPITRNGSVELFRNEMNQIMDKLTRGQSNFLTCSIVGMGGTGKTTLAKLIYENQRVVRRFDITGWITVSQEFKLRELLVCLLREMKAPVLHETLDCEQIGDKLYRHIFGRRYLIVMDDVWDIEALYKLKTYLPDNRNGSRIMVTTRISNVATHSRGSCFVHRMNFLDEGKSWELFSAMIFGKGSCPPELKESAKTVSRNCKGLLLALSMLGGLLANSNITQENLEYIARDTMAIVNSNNEDHCFEILSTSYNNLPVHLKPCFLYLGVFEEDHNINVEDLKRLWVCEGLLKPSRIKSMEEVADDCLKDLIGRNLIFVSKFGRMGNVRFCKMHDLIRDLCLREARKDRFLYVTKFAKPAAISQGFDGHRRVAIHNIDQKGEYSIQFDSALKSSLFPRSLIHELTWGLTGIPFDVKLLRVLSTYKGVGGCLKDGYFNGLNLRYISTYDYTFPSSIHLFWNLQSLCSYHQRTRVTAPSAIWEIPLLRHVCVTSGFYLSDPLVEKIEGQDDIVLENLQTLGRIIDFTCTEEVLRKFPNIKKLVVVYQDSKMSSTNSLQNLSRLQKLETLFCEFNIEQDWTKPSKLLQTLEFPLSLKYLYLESLYFSWEDMGRKFGSLPHLEKLKLGICYWGEEWETVEDQFLHLKCLKLFRLGSWVRWITDSAHFPCLEHLVLEELYELEEIPSEIGDIQTLQSITVSWCSESIDDSAKRILKDQCILGNWDLIVIIDDVQVHLD